jgi:NAD(P)-dependent dehydrogenase (short-subunit alcohol dehydrogenase family)
VRYKGKVCLVTGGASGIGLATVRRFLDEGARVAVADTDPAGEAALREAGADAARTLYLQTDVRQPDDLDRLVKAAEAQFGRINVLFANAGRVSARDGKVDALDLEAWDELTGVNARGVYLTCRAVLPSMLAAGGGAIVITSSLAAFRASMATAYPASKGALVGLSRSIALQYGPQNIRCNTIAPGSVKTLLAIHGGQTPRGVDELPVPMKRQGRPEEVAALVAFLCSDEAGRVTGGLVPIDGGWAVFGMGSQARALKPG